MHTPSAPAAASPGEAWLAPGQGSSAASGSGSHNNPSSSAVAPSSGSWRRFSAEAEAHGAGHSGSEWVWQVRAGKKKNAYWLTVADDCAAILEHAYQNGLDSCTWEWDGWTYYYEMGTMTQCSPGDAATERRIRRVHHTQVDDDSAS